MRGNYRIDRNTEEYYALRLILRGIVRELMEVDTSQAEASVSLDILNIGPSLVIQIFEDEGYESHWEDDNGWEQDTWYRLYKDGCPILQLFWTGYTFSMSLSILEQEEE